MPHFVSFGTGFLALGPYLNVLPLISVALILVSQKMTMPPPADASAEAAAMGDASAEAAATGDAGDGG